MPAAHNKPTAITCSHHPQQEKQFRVESTTNSIAYLPGEFLTTSALNELLADPDCTVTITAGQAI